MEGEKRMRHITSIERYGIQKGVEKGVRKGECAILQRQLQRKFQQIPPHYLDKLRKADSDTLHKWGDSILDAKSLTEVFGE
jgi:hypothetical protein